MYKDTSGARHLEAQITKLIDIANKSKVNRICDRFLNVLSSKKTTHFQNIVTAHVCKVPPDLDAGLSNIAALRSELGTKHFSMIY